LGEPDAGVVGRAISSVSGAGCRRRPEFLPHEL